jgi:sugar O-acyltransferase (sialic acid O-acetyltransferase NeuD family)
MPLLRRQWSSEDVELVFIDDGSRPHTIVNTHAVYGWEAFLGQPHKNKSVCLAVADSQLRHRLSQKCVSAQIPIIGVRAENAVVMDDVQIGEGACLSPFVTITSNIRIGQCFHANLYAYVEHDCVIGDFVTFAPGAKCNGNVQIDDFAYVGSGAVIKQGTPDKPLVIGRAATIGMGAVVTKNVPPGVTVVGNPARQLQRP